MILKLLNYKNDENFSKTKQTIEHLKGMHLSKLYFSCHLSHSDDLLRYFFPSSCLTFEHFHLFL